MHLRRMFEQVPGFPLVVLQYCEGDCRPAMGVVYACFNPIYFDGRGGGHQDSEGPNPCQLHCFVLVPVGEDPANWSEPEGFRTDNTFINGLELRPDLFLSML